MDLESFQRSFKNYEIDLKPYLIVVSIFISIILIILLCKNNINDFYVTKGLIKNNKTNIVVNIDDLEIITNNKKIMIGENIFTYKIIKINDLVIDNVNYKEVILDIKKLNKKYLIENNVIDAKIIINNTTIFEYLIKTMKGEWRMKEVSKEELKKINGGGISVLTAIGISAAVIFIIGVIDGYVRPKKCDE